MFCSHLLGYFENMAAIFQIPSPVGRKREQAEYSCGLHAQATYTRPILVLKKHALGQLDLNAQWQVIRVGMFKYVGFFQLQ